MDERMTDTETTPLEEFVDDSAPDEVEKAKTMGWKAPSDWKGSPPKGKFLKAKEYLERAETVIPIMRAENKKLKDELDSARADLKAFKDETSKTVARMAQMSKVALDRQRTQLEDKYSAAIEAATEVGDKEQVRKLRQAEREDLKKFDEASEIKEEKVEQAKEKVNGALPKETQDTIAAWIDENDWYSTDAEMQAVANAYHGKLLKDKPGLSLSDNLEETRKYVAKRYPEKFKAEEEEEPEEDEKPSRASRVEGGSRSSGGTARSKYSQLPADAKSQCDKFIKEDGLFLEKGETAEKDLAKARERYATQYLES
jgi:hypothetical protein